MKNTGHNFIEFIVTSSNRLLCMINLLSCETEKSSKFERLEIPELAIIDHSQRLRFFSANQPNIIKYKCILNNAAVS